MKYLFFLLIPIFMSCEDAIYLDSKTVTSIQYKYQDSSVPPRYHRSYVITITPNQAHVKVDSYGDILADEVYMVSSSQFNALIETINAAQIISGTVEAEQGCVGGTSESLTITENEEQVYSCNIDNCGGTSIPKSFGDYQSVISEIKKLIPNLAELRK